MMSTLDVLLEVGRWSMDALWLPMLVWTAVALPVFFLQRLAPGVTSHTRYWTTLGLTASLPIGLVAGAFVAFDTGPAQDLAAIVVFPSFEPAVSISSASTAFSWSLFHSAGALTFIAVLLAAVRMAALVAATRDVRGFGSTAMVNPPELVAEVAAGLADQIGLDREIHIGMSNVQSSPLTFGWRSPVVVLPRHLLTAPDDLRLALAHEFVHIRRRDYLWQWCEHLVGAIFFIHPLVTILRNEASVLREITCDSDVLAYVGDRSRYARLLFHYSTGNTSRGKLAIGILLQENHLKKRIEAMKHLLDFTTLSRSKRAGLLVSLTLLAVTVFAVACTDLLFDSSSTNSSPPLAGAETADGNDDTYVIVEQMPELVGGLASVQKHLRYPEIAKEAGVSGRVIVQFVVDEKGKVVDPQVVRGIGSGLDEAALNAVRQITFQPGIQRGEPVRVKMSLPVTFKLPEESTTGDAALQRGDMTADKTSPDVADVDQLPEIIGGLQAVQQELKYPAVAKRSGIEGSVIVEFVVSKSGTVQDARIARGVDVRLDEEALRVVRNSRFLPAQKNGEPVAMTLALPITFRLSPANETVQIEIGRDGAVFLNGKRTEPTRLASELRELVSDANPMVTMRVAQEAPADIVRLAQEQVRSSARRINYKVVQP